VWIRIKKVEGVMCGDSITKLRATIIMMRPYYNFPYGNVKIY